MLGTLAACGFEAAGGSAPDATGFDAPLDPSCEIEPDLARWPLLNAPTDLDTLNGVPATAMGAVTPITAGPCGGALELTPTPAIPFMTIADRPAWDDLARIELWVRTTDAPLAGILSRDSNGSQDGTVALYEATLGGATRLFAVRLQQAVPDTTDILCGPRPAPGTWVHIRIELGPPNELYIDGVKADVVGGSPNLPGNQPCSTSTIPYIPSQDPFVLGAANAFSDAGTTSDVRDPFSGGAISNLKFYRRPRP